ncbi:hypothetical protein KFU94_67005 [Chloroflexi bacterium TSY]|nr:hypothetical protein [Chloroflexi bacterium TSY]
MTAELLKLQHELRQARHRINQLERRTHDYRDFSRHIRRSRENAMLLYSAWLAGMPVSRGYMHDLMGMPERARHSLSFFLSIFGFFIVPKCRNSVKNGFAPGLTLRTGRVRSRPPAGPT